MVPGMVLIAARDTLLHPCPRTELRRSDRACSSLHLPAGNGCPVGVASAMHLISSTERSTSPSNAASSCRFTMSTSVGSNRACTAATICGMSANVEIKS